MDQKDMALLIEVEDELHDMDKALEQLAGHGHASGDFIKLDNVFDVIHRNSHEYYASNADDRVQLFFQILMNREMSPWERADVLMNGTLRIQ